MDQSTLLIVMAGAVTVSAIALVIQMCLLFGMYKAVMALRDRIMVTMPKIDELVDVAKSTAQEGRQAIAEFREKSNNILDTGHRQLKNLESLFQDAAHRTTKQLAYAEAVVEDALNRVEDTVALLHKGVLKPIRGVSGIVTGIGAAIQFLLSRRPMGENATLDEEMFI